MSLGDIGYVKKTMVINSQNYYLKHHTCLVCSRKFLRTLNSLYISIFPYLKKKKISSLNYNIDISDTCAKVQKR